MAHYFRRLDMEEQETEDPNHKCYKRLAIPKDRVDLLGFFRYIPFGYASFSPCPCNIFTWSGHYILPPYRKLGVALPFARKALATIGEMFGEDTRIEIPVVNENRVAKAIFKYTRLKPTYYSGVGTVGEILARRRVTKADPE